MQLPHLQFRIWWWMVAVAIMAVLLTWVDGMAVILALGGLALVVIIPAVLAPPGRRLEASSWAGALQPMMVLLYLYATWVTAWCVLGHRPRPSLDDPKSISSFVDVPCTMFLSSLVVGAPISLGTGLLVAAICWARRAIVYPLLILPFAWLTAYAALILDPLQVMDWFMD